MATTQRYTHVDLGVLMDEYRLEAARRERPVSRMGLVVVVAIWVIVATLIAGWLLWPHDRRS